MTRTRRVGIAAALVAAAISLTPAIAAHAAITQPPQPTQGPGGSDYTHKGVRVSPGGTGADAWYVFEPVSPRPKKAPLAVVMHGYGEFAGFDQMYELIRHTVRKGNVVMYPRWQTGIATPCPGPFLIDRCMVSAVNGIRGALAYLRASSQRVQPVLKRTSYFGFSFGGIITANLANRYRSLDLPKPRAIFLDDPHDGALTGFGEPALDDSLAGIPPSVKLQCHAPAKGAISEPSQGGLAASCNAVFPKLGQIPTRNKNIVLTRTDTHGTPPLIALHGVCAGGPGTAFGGANAYDWNFCWKVWDALRSCAYYGKDCRYALGKSREHRFLGRWSDARAIKRLKVQHTAPIRP
jgi:hypothetical protein